VSDHALDLLIHQQSLIRHLTEECARLRAEVVRLDQDRALWQAKTLDLIDRVLQPVPAAVVASTNIAVPVPFAAQLKLVRCRCGQNFEALKRSNKKVCPDCLTSLAKASALKRGNGHDYTQEHPQ